MIQHVKDDPILQVSSQEPSMSSKYGLQGWGGTVGWQADIGVNLKFWILNFWLKYIESLDYVGHGTVFYFFSLQKMSSWEPSEVSQIYTFWHFHLKMGKICL